MEDLIGSAEKTLEAMRRREAELKGQYSKRKNAALQKRIELLYQEIDELEQTVRQMRRCQGRDTYAGETS